MITVSLGSDAALLEACEEALRELDQLVSRGGSAALLEACEEARRELVYVRDDIRRRGDADAARHEYPYEREE